MLRRGWLSGWLRRYDHRLLDGREAVTFLVTIKKLIEDPRKMLLS